MRQIYHNQSGKRSYNTSCVFYNFARGHTETSMIHTPKEYKQGTFYTDH